MDSNILSINSYQINIRGIPMEIKELPEDKVAISSQHYELYKHLLQGTKPIKHGHQYYYWVTFKKKSINPEHITVHEDLIIQNIKDIVIQEIHKLLDYYHILKLIELVRQHNKHLIADTIDFRISTIYIQRIMANLLREEVSMKDVMYFFERLNYYCQTERNPDVISEKIRMDYSDTICHHWRDDDNQIHAIKVSDPWQCILINPKESESLLKKVEEKLDRHGLFDGRRPILICQPKLRQTLFLALCKHIPNIVVLSETEINVSTKLIITDEI